MDPNQDPKESKNIIKELMTWSKFLGCDVQPVSIFSESILSLPLGSTPSIKKQFEDFARKKTETYLKKTGAKSFLDPELLFIPSGTSRKMALRLAKYSEDKNSLVLFAQTRAKKTWNPFRLGGFAETLVASSRVPVLLMNPSTPPSGQISSILFPTNFSKECKNALMRLTPWAQAFKANIILFNQVEQPNYYAADTNGMWPAQGVYLESMLKEMEDERKDKAENLSALLKTKNVSSSTVVRRQRKYIGAEIIDVAKQNKVGLIAVTNRSGPLAQKILGGIARDVLLEAKCPVLVFFRPSAVRESTAKKTPKLNRKFYRRHESSRQQEGMV